MGIDYDSKLIFGWAIDYESLIKYLKENKADSCGGEEHQCLCGPECWDTESFIFNKSIFFVSTSPYFDCPSEECLIFISLTKSNLLSIEEITNILKNKKHIASSKELVNKLGGDGSGDPKIFSQLDIW